MVQGCVDCSLTLNGKVSTDMLELWRSKRVQVGWISSPYTPIPSPYTPIPSPYTPIPSPYRPTLAARHSGGTEATSDRNDSWLH
eukprot:633385-Prorocentrum_minimum.AAC.2